MSGSGMPHCVRLIGESFRREKHRACDSNGQQRSVQRAALRICSRPAFAGSGAIRRLWTPLASGRNIFLNMPMRAHVVYLRTGEYRSWSKSRQVLKLVPVRDRKWEQLPAGRLRRK